MSAEVAVRGAVIDALRADTALMAGINGVFDGAPVRASAPYAVVGECIATDWGAKDVEGRELKLSVSLHEAGDGPGQLAEALGRTDAALRTLAAVAGNWRIVSARLLRSRLMKAGSRDGWQAVVDYRLRVVADEPD